MHTRILSHACTQCPFCVRQQQVNIDLITDRSLSRKCTTRPFAGCETPLSGCQYPSRRRCPAFQFIGACHADVTPPGQARRPSARAVSSKRQCQYTAAEGAQQAHQVSSMFDKVLHRGKTRPAPELVTKTMAILERANDVSERQLEEVSRNISAMKSTMFSAGESDAGREAATLLAYEVIPPHTTGPHPKLDLRRSDSCQTLHHRGYSRPPELPYFMCGSDRPATASGLQGGPATTHRASAASSGV